jgi:hypothetical protein
VIGAPGTVLLDSTDVGATTGSVTFRVVQTRFAPDINGITQPLAETYTVTNEHGELEVATAELSAAAIGANIPGSISTSTGVASAVGGGFTTTLASATVLNQQLAIKLTSVTALTVGMYLNFGTGTQVRQVTRVGTLGSGGTGIDVSDPLSVALNSGATVTQFTGDAGTQYSSGTLISRRLASTAFHTVEARVSGINGLRYVFGLRGAVSDNSFEAEMGDETLFAPKNKFVSGPAAATYQTLSHWYITRIPADV